MASRVVLIDGSSLIFRAYFAIPNSFSTATGLHTNATYGFALMFRKILSGKTPEYAAVVFDAPGATFRDEKFPEYKAQRPAMANDLAEQLPWIDKVVDVHHFPVLRVPGFEADDVIGTLTRMAREAGHEVHIISADKDFAQLITNEVKMVDTMRDLTYDPEVVRKKWGVPPSQMRDYLALVGDSVDNVPGVPGIGQKTATQLLEQYGDLQTILDSVDDFKGKRRENFIEHREQALLSQELVTIDQHVPLEVTLDDLRISMPDQGPINDLYRELEFNSLLAHEDQHGIDGIDTDKFETVSSHADLKALLAQLAGDTVAVQTVYEPWDHNVGTLVGLAIANSKGEGWYVPFESPEVKLGSDGVATCAEFLADPKQPKVLHDFRDQWCLLQRHGIDLDGVVFDTQLASYLIDPTKLLPHELDQVTKEFLQRTLRPLKQLVGVGQSQVCIHDCPVSDTTAWACHLAKAIAQLRKPVSDRLEAEGQVPRLMQFHLPLSRVLGQMQLIGIRVDPVDLEAMEDEFEERKEQVAQHIYELAGKEFNIGSTKQLGEVLFDELKLPVLKKTKTGYSTAADVLERLAIEYEIASEIVRWRTLAKLINTYTRVLRESRNPKTGRVHATFQQTVSSSGRLITTNPDLQRTPIRGEDGKRIRHAFIPADGWVMISADWSQIELRILAHFSQDPALLDSFRNDIDLHRRTASQLFDCAPADVTPKQRDMGKTVNFATIYGQGATALSQQLGITRNEAKRMIERYFEVYAGVRTWVDGSIANAYENGYVETIIGRRRYVPELQSNNPTVKSYGERIASNTPIQGSAADLCLLTMMQIHERLEEAGMETRMLIQIHDELVFEAPPHEVDAAVKLIRDRMENPYELSVPLKVEIGTGANWAEAH